MKLVISANNIGKRLDIFSSENTKYTRSGIRKLLDEGHIKVNGKKVKAGYSLNLCDVVEIEDIEPKKCSAEPADIPIDIIYQDDSIAIINKKQGMITHPTPTTSDNTLVNALMHHLSNLSDINGTIRPGIVHRLDKNTSGLLVVAKNNKAHINLSAQIASKTARRIYVGLVDGNIKEDEGIINAGIARSNKDRKKMAVDSCGREATTKYKVIDRYGLYTLLRYELLTGRTHQIRVHSSHIKHSIVGDSVYGGSNKFNLIGQLLHAERLIIKHPDSKEMLEFYAPLPEHFTDVLAKIEHLKK